MLTLPCTRAYEDNSYRSLSYKIITNSLPNNVGTNIVVNIAIFNRLVNYIIAYCSNEMVFVFLIFVVITYEYLMSWNSVHSYLSIRSSKFVRSSTPAISANIRL